LDSKELPLPHIGWNDVHGIGSCALLEGLEKANDFYFVHSYAIRPELSSDVAAQSDYGNAFPAIVRRENIWGVQFHPEKSQKTGTKLMKNFLKMNRP
jgi:glutamine amidotransferase